MESFITLGKKIYHIEKSREARRMVVFVARAMLNCGRMEKLDAYFHQTKLLAELAEIYPFVYEQPTRAFFYNKSKFDDRARIVEEHMEFLTSRLKAQAVLDIYKEKDQVLWTDEHEGESLRLVLYYEPGQRKEGILSVILRLGDKPLY